MSSKISLFPLSQIKATMDEVTLQWHKGVPKVDPCAPIPHRADGDRAEKWKKGLMN
jgi:hypothetical protein